MSIEEENNRQIKMMAQNFKSMRQLRGWSIGKLSDISGINKKILTQMEEGKDFDVQYLMKLCGIYHIKLHEVFYLIAPPAERK